MLRRETAIAGEDEFVAMTDAVNAIEVTTAKDVPEWATCERPWRRSTAQCPSQCQ